MDGSTALAVLGLEPGATKQQVKTAFRTLVKEVHPDASAARCADETRFCELHAAYELAFASAPAEAPSSTPSRVVARRWLTAAASTAVGSMAPTIDVTDARTPVRAMPTTRSAGSAARSGAEAEFAALLDVELSRA